MSERTESGLAYERTGEGPAVLLVHAGIADRSMWEREWRRWRSKFTLVRFDQRGFRDSPDPEREYSLHGDALEVLDAAGIERAAFVGASLGGRAVVDLALAAPDRVTALVAVVATPSGWEHDAQLNARFEAVGEAYEREGIEAANEVELRMWVDGPQREPSAVDPEVRAAVARMNRAALEREEARERDGTGIEPTPLEPPALARLGEIGPPALIVTGELDQPSVNAGAAALARGTGAATASIAATAHMPNLERPAEFDAAVLGFLERHAT